MHPHLLQPLGILASVRAVQAVIAVAVIAALWMAFAPPVGAQPPPEEPTIVLCDESSGRLVELPESIAEGALHFPAHLATEAEIAAGECEVTAPDFGEDNGENEDVPDSGQEAPAEVVALPETGTGSASPGTAPAPLAGLLAVLAASLALVLRRRDAR